MLNEKLRPLNKQMKQQINSLFVQLIRKLEAPEATLGNNAKVIIPKGSELVNIVGEMAGIVPISNKLKE